MDSPSQDKSGSLILGNCLNCQGLVRVPSTAPSDSTVRCPHCSQQYRLAQILDKAIPELEIVDNSVGKPDIPIVDQVLFKKDDDSAKGRETFVVPSQLSKGAIRTGRRRSRSSSGSSRQPSRTRESNLADMGNGSPRSQRGSSSSSSHRRRSSGSPARVAIDPKNPVTEMIKVIIGGLLAIPIAYSLIFFIPGLNMDPLSIAPTLEKIAPSIVPVKLRSEANEVDDSAAPSKNDADSNDELLGESGDDETLAIPILDPDLLHNPDGN